MLSPCCLASRCRLLHQPIRDLAGSWLSSGLGAARAAVDHALDALENPAALSLAADGGGAEDAAATRHSGEPSPVAASLSLELWGHKTTTVRALSPLCSVLFKADRKVPRRTCSAGPWCNAAAACCRWRAWNDARGCTRTVRGTRLTGLSTEQSTLCEDVCCSETDMQASPTAHAGQWMDADALADTSSDRDSASRNPKQAEESEKGQREDGANVLASSGASTVCGDDLQLLSCHDSYIYVSCSCEDLSTSAIPSQLQESL